MINISNKGRVAKLVDTDDNRKYIVLSKDIILEPKSYICIKPKIQIECTEYNEECWVYPSKTVNIETNEEVENASLIGLLTSRITKNDGLTTVELYGGYLGEEAMTLPKGTVLAEIHQLYTEYVPEPSVEEDTMSHIIYSDDNISIHSLNGTVDSCELIIEPEGESYIKVHLPA